MAEFAVQEALALACSVKTFLNRKFKCPDILHEDIYQVERILNVMEAYIIDFKGGIHENRQQIRNVAFDIVNSLDELMLRLVQLVDRVYNKWEGNVDDKLMLHDDLQTEDIDELSKLVLHDDLETKDTDDDDVQIDRLEDEEVKIADVVRSWQASVNFSSNVAEIVVKNENFINKLFSLSSDLQGGSSSGGRGSKSIPGDSLSGGRELAVDNLPVGYERHVAAASLYLSDRGAELSTILVVGPGGAGKSTLASLIFNHIFEHCLWKTWVRVTRRPLPLKELLQHMLIDFGYNSSEEIDDPKTELRLFLQQKRYLVVLDDVWSEQDLYCIVKALPNGAPGSRMIITSRNSSVVSFLSPKYIHDLSNGLSPEAAKSLFTKRILGNNGGSLQLELEMRTDRILKWCGNLPFAISAVGGLLAEKPQTWKHREDFLDVLGSETGPASILKIVSDTLQPSFIDLPTHLKPCFLYFSIFPPNYAVEHQRLIHLWVAEGFVEPRRGMTVDEVANGFLKELISRNLVLVNETEIGEQQLSVLPHVRDFILAKEENFISVVAPERRTSTALCEEVRRRTGAAVRRLSVNAGHVCLRDSSYLKLKHLHTLMIFGRWSSDDLEWVLCHCKYVRVLDLKGVSNLNLCLHDSSIDGSRLFHLIKYLSLRGSTIRTLPKFIRKGLLLETLDLRDTLVTKWPKYEPDNLRHVLVSSNHGHRVMLSADKVRALSSIHGLSLIEARESIMEALGELKKVRSLGLVDLQSRDGKKLCAALEKLKHLSTLDVRAKAPEFLDLDHMKFPPQYLQGLHLKGRLERLPKWILQLTSLEKINLHDTELKPMVNPLELLQDLPYLIKLDLVAYYTGKQLTFIAGTFKKLMILRIKQLNWLEFISFSEGAVPQLRELVISKCPKLCGVCLYSGPKLPLTYTAISKCPNLSVPPPLREYVHVQAGFSSDWHWRS